MYNEVIDMNSPDLQANLVYHIINISQRLKGNMKTRDQDMKHETTFHQIPKIIIMFDLKLNSKLWSETPRNQILCLQGIDG